MKSEGSPHPAVSITGLTKDFPVRIRGVRLRAVDDLSFEVRAGEVFGLLGPNGSGKSTTIKLILGLLQPTSGNCSIFGVPSREAQSRIDVGYLPEAPNFHRFLTGRELVGFYGRMCGFARAEMGRRCTEVLEVVGLSHAADRRIETYSKGMLQRIGIAQALAHDPRLVILDEPTAGVDPLGAEDISNLVRRLKQSGKTVILCSHLLAQIEDLCDRVAILNKGRLIALGAVSELALVADEHSVSVGGLGPETEEELAAWLKARGCSLLGIARRRRTLEDVYRDRLRTSGMPGSEESN